MRLLLAILLLGAASPAAIADADSGVSADEPSPAAAPDRPEPDARPSITRLDDGRMKIGEITFDPRDRSIRFPAWINQTEGLLEFLLVHREGKTHESLLATDISAMNLNIAFKLLRYKASRHLYFKVNPNFSLSSEFEEATDEEKKQSRLRIFIEREIDGSTSTVEARDWINHSVLEKNMPGDPWIYGGSFVDQGRFVAETSGDLIAIFLSNAALINYSGEDNEIDTVWLPHPTRVPVEGTPVTVMIRPYEP